MKYEEFNGFVSIKEVKWIKDNGYLRCAFTPICDNYFDCGLTTDEFEVIGNIHDNLELLEVKK